MHTRFIFVRYTLTLVVDSISLLLSSQLHIFDISSLAGVPVGLAELDVLVLLLNGVVNLAVKVTLQLSVLLMAGLLDANFSNNESDMVEAELLL